MVMDPNGPLIGYAWYEKLDAENARLKAENERLRKDTSMMLSVYWKHYELLRKAGDAMAERLNIGFTEVPWKYGPKWYAWHSKAEASVNGWNAAKEGKQP